jgi:hypothetical protein
MMSAVVPAPFGIVVMPIAVVDRYAHLWRIPEIQAFGTAVVLVTPKVLWVIDVWVVVKPLPILCSISIAPYATVGLLSIRLPRPEDGRENGGAEKCG